TVKEEEIDLGKLFSLIGNAFSKLFSFIGNLLKGVFHYLVILLIFLKENILKIGISIILGASIGFVLDYITPPSYTYDMIIEPNYKSIDQIYEKTEYYNVLVSNKDSMILKESFNISYKSANSIVGFELNPYETRKDQILAYDAFLKTTDTLTHEYFTFNDFISDRVSKFDSKRYIYRITSTSPNMELFGDEILADIEKNPTIQKRKRIQLSTLKLDSIAARLALREIDSLRNLYKKVTLLEVEKEVSPNSSSTYLDFSKESKSNNNDLELFKISKSLNADLVEIESKKETSEDIINVITTFNSSGKKEGVFYETKMFLLGRLFGGIMLIFILLKKLNGYLTRYKEQILD
ncbi:MAG: hypothetical protein PSN34_16015, partial [Urechidicola sp.]|nr:hypothetical protein [Urechidicola sp.]